MKQGFLLFSLVMLLILVSPIDRVRSQNAYTSDVKKGPTITLPNKAGSLRFAVFGDAGTGKGPQLELAEKMAQYHAVFPFEFVLMTGDNLYGSEKAEDYREKFEQPYKKLLDAGVKFYGTLGNHDNTNQRSYKNFNMGGKEYYTFKKSGVRFFSLNSNYMDQSQIRWLESELKNSGSDWKICFFHHPLYSSGGRHGPDKELRKIIEPTFINNGVDVVFSGHEHFYERLRPQKSIYYFISGAGGKLAPNDVKRNIQTEKSFDQDLHFMLIEIVDNVMYFQVISRSGKTIDSGAVPRRDWKPN